MAIEQIAAVGLPRSQILAAAPADRALGAAPADVAAFERARVGEVQNEGALSRIILDWGNYQRPGTEPKLLRQVDRMRTDVNDMLVSIWHNTPRTPPSPVDPANAIEVATAEAIERISEATKYAIRISLKMAILGIYLHASTQSSKSASDDFKSMLKQQ